LNGSEEPFHIGVGKQLRPFDSDYKQQFNALILRL
jgi:hypothetical protein